MAYAFNWNPEDKMSDTEIIDHIKGIVPDYTENRFHVGFASDDGGRHICVYVEKGHPLLRSGKSALKAWTSKAGE